MNKKSMSVPEMRRLLGLGKTDSYWLIKKRYFKTVMVNGHMRILIDSFEEWYANQVHYKKVDGNPPGKNWQHTYSVQEVSELLGISETVIYELMKKGKFILYQVGVSRRIDKESFERWYESQDHYKKVFKDGEISNEYKN